MNKNAVRSSLKYSCIHVSTSFTIPSTTWIFLIYSYTTCKSAAVILCARGTLTLEWGPYPCPVVSNPSKCRKNIVCRERNL